MRRLIDSPVRQDRLVVFPESLEHPRLDPIGLLGIFADFGNDIRLGQPLLHVSGLLIDREELHLGKLPVGKLGAALDGPRGIESHQPVDEFALLGILHLAERELAEGVHGQLGVAQRAVRHIHESLHLCDAHPGEIQPGVVLRHFLPVPRIKRHPFHHAVVIALRVVLQVRPVNPLGPLPGIPVDRQKEVRDIQEKAVMTQLAVQRGGPVAEIGFRRILLLVVKPAAGLDRRADTVPVVGVIRLPGIALEGADLFVELAEAGLIGLRADVVILCLVDRRVRFVTVGVSEIDRNLGIVGGRLVGLPQLHQVVRQPVDGRGGQVMPAVVLVGSHLGPRLQGRLDVAIQGVTLAGIIKRGGSVVDRVGKVVEDFLVCLDGFEPLVVLLEAARLAVNGVGRGLGFRELEDKGIILSRGLPVLPPGEHRISLGQGMTFERFQPLVVVGIDDEFLAACVAGNAIKK